MIKKRRRAKAGAAKPPRLGEEHVRADGSVICYVREEDDDQRSVDHYRTIDTLSLMLRNGSITDEMHNAGQEFNRIFVFAQMSPIGAPPLERLPGGQWHDSITERVVWARRRLDEALDAVGGINSPGGCAVWHVAGLGRSVREWSALEGWNGRTLNQYEAKGILVSALGVLAVHYGYARQIAR